MKLINIGFGSMVAAGRILAIMEPASAPIKRIVQEAKADGMLIDATCGRKCKSVLISESSHVVLSAVSCETIQNRAEEREDKSEQ